MGCAAAGTRPDVEAGHGTGGNTQYTIAEAADLIGKADANIADAFGGGGRTGPARSLTISAGYMQPSCTVSR